MREAALRLDLWLWHARFAKTRSLAARLCEAGAVTLNGAAAGKAASVRIGDRVSAPQGRMRRTVDVRGLGERRGPPAEARLLYEEPSPPQKLGGGEAWEPLLSE
jgi:ribosome-associated heat shock protein Hsp15